MQLQLIESLAIMLRKLGILCCFLAVFHGDVLAATDPWVEVRSSHFTVLTDSHERQARRIADQFERMRWMFQTLFPKSNVDPVLPIVVLAAKSEKSFQALEPAVYLAKGQIKLGGYFLRNESKIYVLLRLDAEQEHPYATIYHEYTHLQFSDDSAWLPIWLNEGIAEFIQNTEIHDKDVSLGEPSADDILYLRQNRLIPLPVLFQVDSKSPYYHEEQKGSVFYAESWALTHYLFLSDRQNGTNRIGDYWTRLSHHEDPVAAAEHAFGDLKSLEAALDGYIRRGEYKHLILPSAAAPIDESAYTIRVLTPTESEAARADVLACVGRVQDSRALLDAVLKADPNNVRARETLGWLAFRDQHIDEARKWYAEAVQYGSRNFLTHYYFASLSLRQADPQLDAGIEASLREAIELNPRFMPAYDLLQSMLLNRERLEDAQAVANLAAKSAGTASEAAMAKKMQTLVAQALAFREKMASARAKEPAVPPTPQPVEIVDTKPRHPTEPLTGAKQQILGVIRQVNCSYPAVIEFRVVAAKKTVTLYNNNFSKLDFTVLGFTPPDSLNPCSDIEGMKARVEYVASSDKTVGGQATAVELRK